MGFQWYFNCWVIGYQWDIMGYDLRQVSASVVQNLVNFRLKMGDITIVRGVKPTNITGEPRCGKSSSRKVAEELKIWRLQETHHRFYILEKYIFAHRSGDPFIPRWMFFQCLGCLGSQRSQSVGIQISNFINLIDHTIYYHIGVC